MTRVLRLSHLYILISVFMLLLGCAEKASVESVDERDPLPDRTTPPAPVFTQVDEPFYASENGEAGPLELSSFDPNQPADDIGMVQQSDVELIEELHLETGRVSVAVNRDIVFRIDHESNEIRGLSSFTAPICEILTAETVSTTETATELRHHVLNQPWVYVVTTSGDTFAECDNANTVKQYQKLPLNYLFNARDVDDDLTNEITTVNEAEARAQLVFGWVDDPDVPGTDEKVLDYGYLGYSLYDEKLYFFDSEKEIRWTQDRSVERFDSVSLDNGGKSPTYLSEIWKLNHTHYLLQLGTDIFVVDATEDLFGLDFPSVPQVFSDRILSITAETIENPIAVGADLRRVDPVEFVSNETDILLFDDGKIFHLEYDQGPQPNTVKDHLVIYPNITLDDMRETEHKPFSQFNLKACSILTDASERAECESANNADAFTNPGWQFITDCEASLGCDFDMPVNEACVLVPTGADGEILCSASEYAHLDELDEPANDADFRGFMQYEAAYMRDRAFFLYDDSVFITAKMSERDILLRYFYNVDLSEPKNVREQLLIGATENSLHQNIKIIESEDQFYISSLVPKNQKRFNECYKNAERVACDLGNSENGNNSSCTGKDLAEGLCVDFFEEYASMAYLCSLQQLNDGDCSDNNLAGPTSISVIDETLYNARWIKLKDLPNQVNEQPPEKMYIFRGSKDDVEDEGVLVDASLFQFNTTDSTIEEGSSVARVDRVEDVLNTSFIQDVSLARLDLVSADPLNTVTGKASVGIFYLQNPEDKDTSMLYKVGTRVISP